MVVGAVEDFSPGWPIREGDFGHALLAAWTAWSLVLGVFGFGGAGFWLAVFFGGVRGLVTGPRSKVGVRRRIQRIRDAGIGAPDYDSVDEELREQGLI